VTEAIRWEEAVRRLVADPAQRDLVAACYFDPPLGAAWRRYHEGAEWAEVRSFLPPPPGRALDLGAGNGIVAAALAFDGYAVTAVEPDPSDFVGAGAIRAQATADGLPITVVEAFGEALPLADEAFDVVIARQVLHHARDLPALCRECARLVRPGGVVITLRDHIADDARELEAFLAKHPLHHLYGGEHAFPHTAYVAALEGAGLDILRDLKPFDGAINMAPADGAGVMAKVADRIARLPGVGAVLAPLARAVPFPLARPILNRFAREPGRLHSFVCRKPAP